MLNFLLDNNQGVVRKGKPGVIRGRPESSDSIYNCCGTPKNKLLRGKAVLPLAVGQRDGRLPKAYGDFLNFNIPAVMCLGFFLFAVLFPCLAGFVFGQENKPQEAKEAEPEYAGELFGVKVPLQNYYFVKSAAIVFGNRWGAKPRDPKEEEDFAWDQLLYSFAAFQRDIAVTQEELEQEIDKALKEYNVDFDRKTNPEAYKKWVEEKTGESVELFQNQIRHLLQIDKLRQQVMDAITPEVNDQEALQLFLDEHNSLSVELVQFDQRRDAEEFYKKVRGGKKQWEKEKSKKPDIFKRPGFTSAIFQMDIWGFDRDAVYEMLKMKPNSVHGPAKIYKGYGVFLVLDKRMSSESEYEKEKNAYHEKIKARRKYEGLNEWFKNLKIQAKIKVYKKEEKLAQ